MKSWEHKLTGLSDHKLVELYFRVRRELQQRKEYRITHQNEMFYRSQIAHAEIDYLERLLLLPDTRN